ncbi:MAG: hypothetical protein NLN64_05165 [Candidatus Thalassarchaeaceae archaeon]|nr:hypothetical protein [Candidatus Thalassarchaeaceae archaeon]
MSDGGLLKKALEQQALHEANGDIEVIPDAVVPKQVNINLSKKNIPVKKILSTLAIGGLLPIIVIMWFGIYIIPDLIPITIVTPIVTLASLVGVWLYLDIGLPVNLRGQGIATAPALVVAASYLSMLLIPIMLGVLLVGDMSIGEVKLSDDGTEFEVKIRQNGGSSSSIDAYVEVGDWNQIMQLRIDESDGLGDYGKLTISISDFYTVNALPSSDYILKITVDGNTMLTTLDGNDLSRTIDDVHSSVSAILSDSDDDCSSTNDCVIGVSLTAWAGLSSNDLPGSLSMADYNLTATLYYEDGNLVIDYPDVSVEKAIATWDSNSESYGSGQYDMGDVGAELPLEGSIVEPGLGGFKYIPKDQWEETDFGCYYFVVTVTQSEPWSGVNQEISHTSHYIYAEEEIQNGPNGTGGGSQETWTAADSCN